MSGGDLLYMYVYVILLFDNSSFPLDLAFFFSSLCLYVCASVVPLVARLVVPCHRFDCACTCSTNTPERQARESVYWASTLGTMLAFLCG